MVYREVGRLFCFVLVVISLICFSFGCITTAKKPAVKIAAGKKIAVVPFMNYADESVSKTTNSKTGAIIDTLQTDAYLTERLVGQLKLKGFHSITLMPEVIKKSDKVFLVEQIRQSIPVGTEILVLSRIFRFRERKGRNFAVTAPASVALDIRLIDVATGKVIHHYEYNETQRSLSENILKLKEFIKRKGRWVRAIELADYGVEEGVNRITY